MSNVKLIATGGWSNWSDSAASQTLVSFWLDAGNQVGLITKFLISRNSWSNQYVTSYGAIMQNHGKPAHVFPLPLAYKSRLYQTGC